MTKIKEIDLDNLSTVLTAKILGIARPYISELHNKGVLEQSKKGKYNIFKTNANYINYVRNAQVSTPMQSAALSLKEQQAKSKGIENQKLMGELLPIEDVQHVLNETMVIIAGMLSGLGGRLSGVLANIDDPGEIRKIINDEVKEIRSTAADKLMALSAQGNR